MLVWLLLVVVLVHNGTLKLAAFHSTSQLRASTLTQAAGVFDHIIVNSNAKEFETIAHRLGVEFYHRPDDLGSSSSSADVVVADAMKAFPDYDVLLWLNSVSPLQPAWEVARIVQYWRDHPEIDTLYTVREMARHTWIGDTAANFDPSASMARTQDLPPAQLGCYSVMSWRYTTFQAEFAKVGRYQGYAICIVLHCCVINQDRLCVLCALTYSHSVALPL